MLTWRRRTGTAASRTPVSVGLTEALRSRIRGRTGVTFSVVVRQPWEQPMASDEPQRREKEKLGTSLARQTKTGPPSRGGERKFAGRGLPEAKKGPKFCYGGTAPGNPAWDDEAHPAGPSDWLIRHTFALPAPAKSARPAKASSFFGPRLALCPLPGGRRA